jgi:hypothetical protein
MVLDTSVFKDYISITKDSGILKNLAASCGLQLQVTSSLFKEDGTKFEVSCFSDVYSGIFELSHD